uniref:ODAD1 central coiled coil region domain-containing protein n=1 Tax=Hemiselmis andersenii TaxID=464988 RepID=A0A6U2J1Z8_HEMAN
MELRERIAELSTAGFDEDDFNVGSLSQVARLAEEAETYSAKIEMEKRKITDAERKLKEVEVAIKDKKDFLAQYAPDTSLAKQVQRMRDSLDLSIKKFATEISDNKKAREEINELRRERRRFKQLMAQNKGKLVSIQQQVREVVSESQAWLEERGEYASAIEELQHGADTAQEEFFAQCRELKHVMRAFDSMEDRLNKGEFDLPNHMGNMTAEQEEDLQKKVVKGKWQLAKEKAMTDLLKEQALSFEEAFEKLQVATGFAKIEDFVSHFIQIEELNFHRFQYMHSLNMDIDKMDDEIKDLQGEASKALAENKGKDDHWQQLKHNTMAKVDRLTEQDRHLEGQIRVTQGTIERLAAVSREICGRIGISDKELADMGIHHDSDPMMVLLDMLGRIESRAIVLTKYAHILKDDDDQNDFDLEGSDREEAEDKEEEEQQKDTAPIYLHPRAPEIRDDEEGEAIDDVPLSAQYLRNKMAGRGEEFLRVALMPGEPVHESARDHRHRAMPNRGGGAAPEGLMRRLPNHQPVPTLATQKVTAGGSPARAASTARGKEAPRISKSLTTGAKTAR